MEGSYRTHISEPAAAAAAMSRQNRPMFSALAALLLAFLVALAQLPAIALATEEAGSAHELKPVDQDLKPVRPVESFKSDVGTVEVWVASAQPLLLLAQVAASKLTLYGGKAGLALPVYSDSPKLHYVIEGSGRVGVVFPGTQQEYVRDVQAGDVVALPVGAVHWWYNPTGAHLSVLSLGDTSKAHRVGEFTDLPLAGSTSVLRGFSPDFLAQAWDVDESVVDKLVQSRKEARLVALLDHGTGIGTDRSTNASFSEEYGEFVYSVKAAKKDPEVANGGRVAVLTSAVLPVLQHIRLGADLVELDPGGQVSPGYSADAAFQVTYIVRGSGRVQIVSDRGERVVDAQLSAGDFFIVPRFYIVSKRAGPQGLQWFSIITTERPIFTNLAGSTSIFKALSPAVLRAALDVDADTEKTFRQRRDQDPVFFPPK